MHVSIEQDASLLSALDRSTRLLNCVGMTRDTAKLILIPLIHTLHSAPRGPFMKMWEQGSNLWNECESEITRDSVALQLFMVSIDCELLLRYSMISK